MENFTNEDILTRYPPCLRDNIQELWTHGQIGISCLFMQINLPPSKLDFDCDTNNGNSFTLNIPYAGKNLQWEVLFNDEDPTSAPDFDILNDSFLGDPHIDTISNYLPTLSNWNIKDSKSLINIIREMLVLYKKYQLEKLENEPKFTGIQAEYKRIKDELKITDDDIEIFVESNTLNILVSLKLDFSNLPIYVQQSYFGGNNILLNPGIDSAILKISFLTTRIASHLQLSPRLEKVFGDYTTLHIPPYKKDDDMVEYIRVIHQLIHEKINQINDHFRVKEEYFSIFLSLHGMKVLEYDNITFSKGWFLFEVNNFYFAVCISIGNKFPQEKPALILRSIYHRSANGLPLFLKINNYPYNPQWKPEEMINKLLIHVQDSVSTFKNFCSRGAN